MEDRDSVFLQNKGPVGLLPTAIKMMPFSETRLIVHYKRFGVSKLKVSLCVCTVITWAYSCHFVGTGAWRNGTNADTLATIIAISNEVLCF